MFTFVRSYLTPFDIYLHVVENHVHSWLWYNSSNVICLVLIKFFVNVILVPFKIHFDIISKNSEIHYRSNENSAVSDFVKLFVLCKWLFIFINVFMRFYQSSHVNFVWSSHARGVPSFGKKGGGHGIALR